MREILFRGKRLDNGEWVAGTTVIQYLHKGNTFIGERGQTMAVYKDAETGNIARICGDYFAVDPETVGQYTGLNDKNDKLIFEGDIVKYGSDLMVVVWQGVTGRFALKFSVDGGYSQSMSKSNVYLDVIGNIHDNPELLKGG